MIQPWEPTLIADIEKAIQTADLGLNPSNDGKVVRVPIPSLTSERRTMLIKKVHNMGEDAKNALRHIRRDGNDLVKKMEKNMEISQDEEHRAFDEIQKTTDAECKTVDDLVAHKDKELQEV